MREREKFKERKPEDRYLIKDLKKRFGAGALSLFLFISQPMKVSHALEISRNLDRFFSTLNPKAAEEEIIKGTASQLRPISKESKKDQFVYKNTLEVTRELNDPKTIKEFLKPKAYFAIATSLPGPYGTLSEFWLNRIFRNLGMQRISDETLSKKLDEKKQGVKGIPNLYQMYVYIEEQRKIIGKIKLGPITITLENKTLYLVNFNIRVQNIETNEVLEIKGVGTYSVFILGEPTPDDEIRYYEKAINNAFENIQTVINEALSQQSSFIQKEVIAFGNFNIGSEV